MDRGWGVVWALGEIFIDVEENIDRENGIGMNVSFPEQEEGWNIGSDPGILRSTLVDNSLLLIDMCIAIGGEGKVIYASAIAVAAAILASEMVFTMHHVGKD